MQAERQRDVCVMPVVELCMSLGPGSPAMALVASTSGPHYPSNGLREGVCQMNGYILKACYVKIECKVSDTNLAWMLGDVEDGFYNNQSARDRLAAIVPNDMYHCGDDNRIPLQAHRKPSHAFSLEPGKVSFFPQHSSRRYLHSRGDCADGCGHVRGSLHTQSLLGPGLRNSSPLVGGGHRAFSCTCRVRGDGLLCLLVPSQLSLSNFKHALEAASNGRDSLDPKPNACMHACIDMCVFVCVHVHVYFPSRPPTAAR